MKMKIKDLLKVIDIKYIDVLIFDRDEYMGLYDDIVKDTEGVSNMEIIEIKILNEFCISIEVKWYK